MRSPQLVHFTLCTPAIYAVNDVWFSKQNLRVWKLCDKTANQRAGGSCIGDAPDASVRISASLSATLTLWQKAFVIWFRPSRQSYLDWATTVSFRNPFDTTVINHPTLRLVYSKLWAASKK